MREKGDLLPAFLNGMLDVMPAGVRVVDGNETAGYVADALRRDFHAAASVTRAHILPLVSPDVYMAPSKSLDSADHQVLVWSRRLTNVRAVFVVKNCREGGGSLLGDTTSGLWAWKRAPTSSFCYPLFDEPSEAVAGGWFYLNGERRDPATGYGYPGAAQDTDVRDLKPVLVECITDGETAADNFSFHQGRGQMISGGMRIYEALVYTNELTNAQRVKVEKCLMDRWIDRGYSPEAAPMRADGVVETLDVSAGAAVDAGLPSGTCEGASCRNVGRSGCGWRCAAGG